MVDCEKLFETVRLRTLQQFGTKKEEKCFVSWCDFEYEHQKPSRPPQNAGCGDVHSESKGRQKNRKVTSSGSEGSHGSPDLQDSQGDCSNNESDWSRGSKRILTPEFRKVLSSPIVEAITTWGDVDEDEKHQDYLYSVLSLGGVVRIQDIPKIPSKYDNDEVVYYGLDTEDNSFGRPHFYQFATRDEVIIAPNWAILMAWLSRNADFSLGQKGHVVWGTNIEYELGNIIKHWSANPDYLDVKWNKGRLTKYDVYLPKDSEWRQKGDNNVHMKVWDTLNHWPRSVKELGKVLTDNLRYDFGKLKFDPYSLRYSAMDAIISRSYAAVQRDYYKQKNIKLFFTPGGTALNVYQGGFDSQGKPFCKHKLYDSHSESELKWLIGALHGGRTEVFSLKEHNGLVGYFDINSAYPYAMKHGVFPNIQTHMWVKGHNDIDRIIKMPVEGVVDCEVDATGLQGFPAEIPYLGTLEKENMRFVFPLGHWRDKYTFFEIRRAVEMGYKFKYIEACYYPRCNDQPFKEYVDFCYAIRDEGTLTGDRMLRDIGKSLGNNLFGKFGQRMRTSILKKVSECEPEDLEGAIIIDESVVIEVDEGFAKHSNVVWSAYITAMCRTLLYDHMLAAAASGNEILYCDTDSIFITGGKWPKSHQTELGALKHEGDLSYFHAYLPKVYTYEMGGKREFKAKGVPYGERERFMVHGIAEYRKPMKVREALRRTSIQTDQPVELGIPAINAWISIEKQMGGNYTKRKVLKDGSTKPLWLKGGDK